MKRSVWIGLVGVRPLPGNVMLENAKGAYVNVLAFVANTNTFRTEVTESLKHNGFDVFDFEDIEEFNTRLSAHSVEPALKNLAEDCRRTRAICLGMFYPFLNDENIFTPTDTGLPSKQH